MVDRLSILRQNFMVIWSSVRRLQAVPRTWFLSGVAQNIAFESGNLKSRIRGLNKATFRIGVAKISCALPLAVGALYTLHKQFTCYPKHFIMRIAVPIVSCLFSFEVCALYTLFQLFVCYPGNFFQRNPGSNSSRK